MILTDFEVNRYGLNNELLNFIEKSGLPVASLGLGKGVIDETHSQFIGTYNGTLSNDYIKSIVEKADCYDYSRKEIIQKFSISVLLQKIIVNKIILKLIVQ